MPRPSEDADRFNLALTHGRRFIFKSGVPFDVFGMPSGHAQMVFYSTTFVYLSLKNPNIRLIVNPYEPGPGNAIRFGFETSKGEVVVVSMADGCDDASQISELVRLVERGVVVASASRYMPGGQQVGGPRLKKLMSRLAGHSFAFFTGVGTRDVTNSFKAYKKSFVDQVGIHSKDGFEIGIELVAKARRLNQPVAEIPTTWIDRDFGYSKFQLGKWLPKYLTWYLFGLGFTSAHKQASKHLRALRRMK
jgi:cellulose synthase/poly-beta-1,6-N-acetylglucosamine synthase-like glycosyltransferase